MRATGGGSVIAEECDSAGLTLKKWVLSEDCTGNSYYFAKEAVNECRIFSYYEFLENTCGGSAANMVKGAQVRMSRKK